MYTGAVLGLYLIVLPNPSMTTGPPESPTQGPPLSVNFPLVQNHWLGKRLSYLKQYYGHNNIEDLTASNYSLQAD